MIYIGINALLWAAAITTGLSSFADTGVGAFVTFVLFIFAIIVTATALGSGSCHLSDLADIQAAKGKIEAGREALASAMNLTRDENGLPEQLLALNQDNNPATRYMELVNSHITNIRYEEERLARAQANIDVRAVGPLSFVVEWIPKPVDHSRNILP